MNKQKSVGLFVFFMLIGLVLVGFGIYDTIAKTKYLVAPATYR